MRIGFYNAQFLPWSPDPKTTSGCCEDIEKRAEYLAERIREGGFDIIALAEVFTESDKETLVKKLQDVYPYYVQFLDGDKGLIGDLLIGDCGGLIPTILDLNPFFDVGGITGDTPFPDDLSQDSGLMLFSKFPFEALPSGASGFIPEIDDLVASSDGSDWRSVAFTTFEDCIGCDCLSNKGAGLVRIRNPHTQRVYTVVFTHLNAGGGFMEAPDIRRSQLRQIQKMIEVTVDPSGTEQIFMLGDFNINGDLALANRDESEWDSHFNIGGGFYTDTFHDIWETQLNILALESDFRDRGLTGGIHEPGGANSRLDYLLANNPAPDPDFGPLCIQHMALALNLRRLVPFEEVAFGNAGVQDLSDHYGIIADVNIDTLQCNPQKALANPVLEPEGSELGTALDGELVHPGNMQWFRFDRSDTYAITVLPQENDFKVQIYDTRNISRPIQPYRDRTRLIAYGVNEVVEASVYDIPESPFFVRVSNTDRATKGTYQLIIRRHQGLNADDARVLTPNAAPPRVMDLTEVSVGNPRRWFLLDTEQADSSRGQRVRFFMNPLHEGAYELSLLESDAVTVRDMIEGSGPLEILLDDYIGGETLFLVIAPLDGTEPGSYEVGWSTNLTVMHKYVPGYCTGEQLVEIRAADPSDEPDKILGANFEDDDNVRLTFEVLQNIGVSPFPVLARKGPFLLARDWDGGQVISVQEHMGAIRFLPDEVVEVKLVEDDSGTRGDDDIIGGIHIVGIGPSTPRRCNNHIFLTDIDCEHPDSRCDTVYDFYYHMSHGIPQLP